MRINHCTIAFNSKEESNKFFVDFLGLEELRSFTAPKDLMKEIFGIYKDIDIIRYGDNNIDIEVFLIDDPSEKKGSFNHIGLKVEDRDSLVDKADKMRIESIVIPRNDSGSYYLFIRDSYGNLYEIK